MKILKKNIKNIEYLCNKYEIINYIINSDNTIDVNGDVHLTLKSLHKLPFIFGNVEGSFYISNNYLKSLYGSPKYVGYDFSCVNNYLNILRNISSHIGHNLIFSTNNIYSLEGIGKVYNQIYSSNNPVDLLINIFKNDYKLYLEYLDMYNFQKKNTNIIYKTRFIEALDDIGLGNLPKLTAYNYV